VWPDAFCSSDKTPRLPDRHCPVDHPVEATSTSPLLTAAWRAAARHSLHMPCMPCRAAAARQALAGSSTTFGDASLAPSCCPLTLTLPARCPCRPLGNWGPEPRASAIFDQRCVSMAARTRVGCVRPSGRTLRAVKCQALASAPNKSGVRRSAASKTFPTGPASFGSRQRVPHVEGHYARAEMHLENPSTSSGAE